MTEHLWDARRSRSGPAWSRRNGRWTSTGMSALQLGFEQRSVRHLRRSEAKLFEKLKIERTPAVVREVRLEANDAATKFEVGKVSEGRGGLQVGRCGRRRRRHQGQGLPGRYEDAQDGRLGERPRVARVLPPRRFHRLPPHPGSRAQGQADVPAHGARPLHRFGPGGGQGLSRNRMSCWSRARSLGRPMVWSSSRAAPRM